MKRWITKGLALLLVIAMLLQTGLTTNVKIMKAAENKETQVHFRGYL